MINLRVLSIAVAVALGMLGAVQLASPESLGISPIAARWLGIIATGLGILAGFLPRVQGPTTDPEQLADRVWELPSEDREKVASDLMLRWEREARIRKANEAITRPQALRMTDEEIVRRHEGLG